MPTTATRIPALRYDIEYYPVEHNGHTYLAFYDSMGYATPNFALKVSVEPLLGFFSGKVSYTELAQNWDDETGAHSIKVIRDLHELLDTNGWLQTKRFLQLAEEKERAFELSKVRPPVCAGGTYPNTKNEILAFWDKAFQMTHNTQPDTSVKVLYAPHIDYRVGLSSYVEAFELIRNHRPKHVILVGTSHYSGMFPIYHERPYIFSSKTFETPLGRVPVYEQGIHTLISDLDENDYSLYDRAHRAEHSLELHLLLLQYLWKDHEFDIVPVLVGAMDDYLSSDSPSFDKSTEAFSSTLSRMAQDEDTLVLISGDLAHIGHKFGDSKPASAMFEEVEKHDDQWLKIASETHNNSFLSFVQSSRDQYRVCGFPPLWSFLRAQSDCWKGSIIDYQKWDERERESGVTFGAIAYSLK